MFDFHVSDDETALFRAAGTFAAERLTPRLRHHEKIGGVDPDLLASAGEIGLALLELPADLGGAGASPLAKALVLEALATADAGAALAIDGLGPALYPLLDACGAAGREIARALAPRPGVRGWVLLDDHAEHVRIESGRVVGTWPWLPASEIAVVVLIENGRAHVAREPLALSKVVPCALHAAGSSELSLDSSIACSGDDPRGVARAVARTRLYAAALLVGVATGSLRHATAYAKERIAFGRPVAHHQGVAFLIADLATRLDAARLSLHRAAWALSQDGDPTEAAAAAQLDAIDASLEIGEQGVQLLGGHGYMQDHPVEKWMREARTLAQLFGGRDGALDALSARALDRRAGLDLAPPAWDAAREQA